MGYVNIYPVAGVSAESLMPKAEQTQFYSLKTAVPIIWIAPTCKSLKDFSAQGWCYKADLWSFILLQRSVCFR